MAYQPKYLRKEDRKSSGGILLGVLAVPLGLVLTALLLHVTVNNVGRPNKTVAPAKTSDMAIMEQFDGFISNEVGSARNALLNVEGEGSSIEETEETVPEKIVYTIPADAQVAPEPNQELFGETDDPSTLQWLLDEAAEIMDGQELFFNTEIELFEGSTVHYYLDETIFAITWKEVRDGSVYTFSEVKVSHPSQFRRHLAGGSFGAEIQYYTTEMAESVNAVVASSGDFHRFRNFGICVYEGQVKRVEGTYAETCYIDSNGDMLFTYGGDILTTAKAKEFVEENDIQFSLCFGPILVDNYEVVTHTNYGVGEITEGYARAALCQLGELHYVVAAANNEGAWQRVPTVAEFTENIVDTGCKMAYCLDGGQTAAIVMNDELINRPVYGYQRKISDIIYFATAIPEGE